MTDNTIETSPQLYARIGGVLYLIIIVIGLFGEAFVEAGDVETGLVWYERAVAAPDGGASMKAAEQLANVRGRLGWEVVDKALRDLADMQTRASVAQAALYAAGVMVDDPEVGDPVRAASAAKITAGEAAILNGKSAIQSVVLL